MEVPALKERPELPRHLHAIWSGFWIASPSRPIGMGGVGGVLLTEVEAVMRLYRIEDWSAQMDFMQLIKGLDHAYLDFQAEKSNAKQLQSDAKKAKT